eukprot:Mrub_05124.p1 GENE.Mrub_05124~~Mrub_05124.p1  ORF type:complete len:309 (-),score=59.89 Mrub_05124:190-1116(-)
MNTRRAPTNRKRIDEYQSRITSRPMRNPRPEANYRSDINMLPNYPRDTRYNSRYESRYDPNINHSQQNDSRNIQYDQYNYYNNMSYPNYNAYEYNDRYYDDRYAQNQRRRLARRGDESRYREQLERRRRMRNEIRSSRSQYAPENSQSNRDSYNRNTDYSQSQERSRMIRLRRMEERMAYGRREEGRYANRRDRERRPEGRSMERLREMRSMRSGRLSRPQGYFGRTADMRPMRGGMAGAGVGVGVGVGRYGSRIDRLKRLEQRISRPKKENLKSAEELDKEIDKYFSKDNKESTEKKEVSNSTKLAE